MARSWQLWLSPRPLVRTDTSHEPTILAANEAARFEFLQEGNRWVVQETHYIDNPIARKGLSGPQLHIHLRQTEYFQVQQGVLGIYKNETEHIVTKADGTVEVPAGTRHRFFVHATSQEDVIFRVWADPQDLDHSFDENFLRNFVGYLRDCQRQGIAPSPFQIILFGMNSATVPCLPFWVPIWILRAVAYVLAYWVAEGLLGYQASYPEYNRRSGGGGGRGNGDNNKKRI
ncbi:cupin domain-containing protein [Aspergillus saccharolyticus JOP 1030-1]|uniref:Cupin 2 conserved barrel domain-containing protein n=1 Tax=Aspergillus saccharolyticus JOP 1030-1 TaxID=1450539 RepID=A0A318ZGN7_9EURO|nr:hypothetical protein BP01DRAFT_422128 [Aspergillus saccharolyticus JOP 1030-1]PYH46716.1 hypothetical protein BP01DRAFT_422128 [Aspergillus saccharolyticus JOP 1030-1]